MDQFFRVDGPLMNFLMKFGQLVILTVVWMICCIPIVTIGSSTSAFYYAVIKSVRRDVGYPVREFWRSFKRTAKDGCILTAALLAWCLLLYVNMKYLTHSSGSGNYVLYLIYLALVFFTAALVGYLFPALSRFDVSKKKLLRMSLTMIFLQLEKTLVLVVVSLALIWLTICFLPIPCVLFIPGVWCYLSTFLVEPALKRFMPEAAEGEKEWYDE